MSIASAQVSARAEQMLRDRLSQRDQHIAELKASVADAESKASAIAKRSLSTAAVARAHPQAATQTLADTCLANASSTDLEPCTGCPTPSATNSAAEHDAVAVSASADPGHLDAVFTGKQAEQTALVQTAVTTQSAAVGDQSTAADHASLPEASVLARPAPMAGGDASAQEPRSPDAKQSIGDGAALALLESDGPMAAVRCAASPQREVSEALADARLELARRDAEIEHLQGTLTQLVAASHAHTGRPSSAASAYEQVCNPHQEDAVWFFTHGVCDVSPSQNCLALSVLLSA